MAEVSSFKPMPKPSSSGGTASARVAHGIPFQPQQQILLYASDEWERFIQEWVTGLEKDYIKVERYSGPGDLGIDIAGFTEKTLLKGIWDNYQCKHYGDPLNFSTGAVEIGKILWYSFKGEYTAPRKYYFIAPRGCGTDFKKLLSNSDKLRQKIIETWTKHCENSITAAEIKLVDDFKDHVEKFDFTIFGAKDSLEIINDHRKTPYFSLRFGGGLPERPEVTKPPSELKSNESVYLKKLFDAYGDHKKAAINDLKELEHWKDLEEHFHRQREVFYHAEALRNFARDTVPPDTFRELQEEVYSGVADVEAAPYPDGYGRLNAVTAHASALQLTSNALITVVKVQDRKGICHQLANEDRLTWKK